MHGTCRAVRNHRRIFWQPAAHFQAHRFDSGGERSYPTARPVRVAVGVSYDSDLEHVIQVTQEVADGVVQDVDGAKKDSPAVVRYFEFADSSVNIKVYFRGLKYGDQHTIIDEFIRRVHKRYNAEGINIPFPIRTLIHQNEQK